jgi:hypothetical protein
MVETNSASANGPGGGSNNAKGEIASNKYFKNCIRVIVAKRDVLVTRIDILKTLDKVAGVKDNLVYISKFEFANHWMLEFKEDYDTTSLIGKELEIKGSKVYVGIGFDKYVYRTYRLLWAPINFNRDVIFEHFRKESKEVEIMEIKEEYYEEDGWKLLSGNIKIKIRALASMKNSIHIQTGPVYMEDYKLFLSLLGEKQKCLICDSADHLKKDCKQGCSVCSKTGHKDGSCRRTYANVHISQADSNAPTNVAPEIDSNDLQSKKAPIESTSDLAKAANSASTNGPGTPKIQKPPSLFDYFTHPETGKRTVETENSKRKEISNLDLSTSLNDSSSSISHENKKAHLNSTGGAAGTDASMRDFETANQNENPNNSNVNKDAESSENQLTIQSIANSLYKIV